MQSLILFVVIALFCILIATHIIKPILLIIIVVLGLYCLVRMFPAASEYIKLKCK